MIMRNLISGHKEKSYACMIEKFAKLYHGFLNFKFVINWSFKLFLSYINPLSRQTFSTLPFC